MNRIMVPTSPGELIDKLTILRLKSENITDKDKLRHINYESNVLQQTADAAIPFTDALRVLWDLLYEINKDLWVVEDDIRACDARGEFGPPFIALARAIYITNDKRAAVKKEINVMLGSDLVEEKSYTPHGRDT